MLGVDSDNDSAFINDTLLAFCKKNQVEFTSSRAYHKNDQAWVEQKNGAVVRRLVGYERFSGVVAGQALAHIYQAARLYVNYFQPSFRIRGKERHGTTVRRTSEALIYLWVLVMVTFVAEATGREFIVDVSQ